MQMRSVVRGRHWQVWADHDYHNENDDDNADDDDANDDADADDDDGDDDDDDDGDGGNDDDDDGTPRQSRWEGHRRVQLLVSQAPPFDTWSLP